MATGSLPVSSHPSEEDDLQESSEDAHIEIDSQSSDFSSMSEHDSDAELEQDPQSSGGVSGQMHVGEQLGSTGAPSSSDNHEISTDKQNSFQSGRASSVNESGAEEESSAQQDLQDSSAGTCGPSVAANGNTKLAISCGYMSSAIHVEVGNLDEVYLEPALGVEYESEDHAYLCYTKFSVDNGFSVRRDFANKNKKTGVVISRKFCCYKQGRNKPTKTFPDGNKLREGRTGCLAHLTVVRQQNGKFAVTQLTNQHNHEFVTASKAHLLPSLKRLAFAQAIEAEMKGNSVVDGVPKLGMGFDTEDQAYEFYNAYAERVGFSIRKDYISKSRVSGTILSRKFSCCREGRNKKDFLVLTSKKARIETRVGCLAHMMIARQPDGKFRVSQFTEEHNHDLIPGRIKDKYDPVDHKNKLEKTRSREMKDGAEKMMHYFQAKKMRTPSFFYIVQVDSEDQVANIVWTDAKMVDAYGDLGDVLCIDTSFRFQGECRPFVPFFGVNHHKQMILFGASLMYDASVESMTWVLQKFIYAMRGRKPRTVITDQDSVMLQAVGSVMPESNHRFCTWHIYQSALDQLRQIATSTDSFANDLRSCFFSPKEEDFIHKWKLLLKKYDLYDDRYLQKLYDEREKWAIPFGKHIFCADITTIQLGESLLSRFRKYLRYEYNILTFLNQLSKLVNDWRYKEIEANYDMLHQPPNMMARTKMLKSASEVYTPKILDQFQQEYEKSLNMVVNQCTEIGESLKYKVCTYGELQEYNVDYNSLNDTVHCECLKFQFVGILCCHALKVLDYRNIKLLPAQYIMKRWTREATSSINQSKDPPVVGDGSART